MPNAETLAIIGDLEKAGFDMTSIKDQANKNPLLDKAINSTIGGGLLRRQEFTAFKEQKEEEVKTLRQQITELAANQDNLKNFEVGSELYQAALEIIETQRENLIEAGFEPEEVKNLSLQTESGLKAAIGKGKEIESKEKEGENRQMPNNQNQSKDDYVSAGELQTVLGNMALGNISSSLRAQHQIRRAEGLGIVVDDAKVVEFEKNLFKGLQSGKSYEAIADETFGISAKLKERQEIEINERIETAKREAVAEALKDAGIQTPVIARNKRSLVTDLTSRNARAVTSNDEQTAVVEGSGGTRVINGKKVPVNKDGEIEFYRLRGTKPERIANASEFMNNYLEKHPEVAEDMMY